MDKLQMHKTIRQPTRSDYSYQTRCTAAIYETGKTSVIHLNTKIIRIVTAKHFIVIRSILSFRLIKRTAIDRVSFAHVMFWIYIVFFTFYIHTNTIVSCSPHSYVNRRIKKYRISCFYTCTFYIIIIYVVQTIYHWHLFFVYFHYEIPSS